MIAARAGGAEPTDPAYWRTLGEQLEGQSKWSEALSAWERVLDQAHSAPADASAAVAHIRALNAKVPANTDPAKAHVWRTRFIIVTSLDAEVADGSAARRRVKTEFSADERAKLARARESFMREVFEYSRGRLRIQGETIELSTPLTQLSGNKGKYWLGPECLAKQFPEVLAGGDYDGLLVWVKLEGVPRMLWGGTLGDGAWDGPPACFSSIQYTSADLSDTGEVELHEWLHQLHLALFNHHGFPWTPDSDGGRYVGAPEGEGYPYYRRPGSEKSWLPFYKTMMGEAITSRMYACAGIRNITETHWNKSWIRTWRVLPYDPSRDMDPDQVAPTQSGEWKTLSGDRMYVSSAGLLPKRKAGSIYAQAVVERATAGEGKLRVGFNGSASVWWNGECVLDYGESPSNPLVSHTEIPVKLGAGKNTLLLRVETGGPPAQWSAGLFDAGGYPLP